MPAFTPPLTRAQRTRRRRLLQALLPVLIPAALLLLFLPLRSVGGAMSWVVTWITSPWKRLVSWLLDPLPCSGAELCWAAAILGLLLFLGRTVWLLVRFREDRLRRLGRRGLALLSALLMVWVGLTWLWGANYYAPSFSAQSGLTARGASAEELYALAVSFAAEANSLSAQMPRDENGVLTLDAAALLRDTAGLYDGILEEFPCLDGPERTPKPMLFSRLMSYLGFTGFFFPLTGEANLNVDSPAAFLPCTVAHELAHQRNVAAEEEANFVAILTCLRSGDPVYRYAGAITGFVHLSNALYRADYDLWVSCYHSVSSQVRADLDANNAYWAQFETPVEDAAGAVYDGFLQSYGQELGMQSYGACVDLLVAYYFDREGGQPASPASQP